MPPLKSVPKTILSIHEQLGVYTVAKGLQEPQDLYLTCSRVREVAREDSLERASFDLGSRVVTLAAVSG